MTYARPPLFVVVSLCVLVGLSACSTGANHTAPTPPTYTGESYSARPVAPAYLALSGFLQASTAEHLGEADTAMAGYQQALQHESNNTQIKERIFNLALALDDIPAASAIAQTFAEADAPSVAVMITQALAAIEQQDYLTAARHLKAIQKISQDFPHFSALLAYVRLAAGADPETTIAEYIKTEPTPSLRAQYWYFLGTLYQITGDLAGAKEHWFQSFAIEPSALFTVLTLGEHLEAAGEHTAAWDVYDAFLELNTQDMLLQHVLDRRDAEETIPMPAARTLKQNMAEPLFGMAMLMWAKGLTQTGRQFMNLALHLDANPYYLFYSGMMYEHEEDYINALGYYIQIEPGPAWVISRIRIMDGANKLGTLDIALAALEELYTTTYSNRLLLNRIKAELLFQTGDYPAAIEVFDELLTQIEDLGDSHARVLFARGASYENLGQFDRAAADLEAALQLEPDNSTLLNYFGYMLLEHSAELDKAFSLISKAAMLEPENGAILDSLGWAYFKRGDTAKALLYLERAVNKVPHDPTILGHLGDVHAKLGNMKQARSYWQQALENLPTEETLSNLANHLRKQLSQ